MRFVRLIICLEERKVVERLRRDSFVLFAAISYYVTTCHHAACVPWAFTEHWPYLATPSKPWVRGKVVRLNLTGLTRPVLRSVKAGPKCITRDTEVCESIAIIRKRIAIVCGD